MIGLQAGATGDVAPAFEDVVLDCCGESVVSDFIAS